MKTLFVFLVAGIAIALAEQFSYDGYKVWSINPQDEQQRGVILEWEDVEGIDFWDRKSNRPLRVMVAPATQDAFVDFLEANNISNEISIENVESIFAAERAAASNVTIERYAGGRATANDFNHFWTLAEINDYETYLANYHSDICTTEVVGYSSQGRILRAVKISQQGHGQILGSRPIVFIDAGIHAREWAAHMATMYFLYQIVQLRSLQTLLQTVDIIVLPVVNPDGYAWSHTNARLWRKTRAPIAGSTCLGIDGNRNYEHMWRSGNAPCAETYPGPSPFSEPETRAVRDILNRYGSSVKLYASMHTYGNYVLYPWGYDYVLINNWQQHDDVGRLYSNAIRSATGTEYTVGNGAIELYPAYGASDDYVAFRGVPLSFTFELPGGGQSGFDLPANQLYRVVTETWTGFYQVLRYAATHNWN